METSNWFDEGSVIGEMSPQQAAAKLREVGEYEFASVVEKAYAESGTSDQDRTSLVFEDYPLWGLWRSQIKPYMHTGYTFGYVAPDSSNSNLHFISSASRIAADPTLKKARLKITLDRFFVAAYPGSGKHRILLHFFVQNQVGGRVKGVENVHFNTTYEVQNGEYAAVQSYPIFIGLNVGKEGLTFKCYTINVENEQDKQFLDILDSGVFKAGLKLATTIQPAIAPLSEMALGLAKMIGKRNCNIPIQDFELGLNFSTIASRARLAEGSYIIIQLPRDLQRTWNWSDWAYHIDSGLVVNKTDPQQRIPYNYLIFSISRYEGE